jgi:hypothetical protein
MRKLVFLVTLATSLQAHVVLAAIQPKQEVLEMATVLAMPPIQAEQAQDAQCSSDIAPVADGVIADELNTSFAGAEVQPGNMYWFTTVLIRTGDGTIGKNELHWCDHNGKHQMQAF